MHLERDILKGSQSFIIQGSYILHVQHNLVFGRMGSFGHTKGFPTNHHARQFGLAGVFCFDRAGHLARPEHRDMVGDSHHLIEFVTDKNNRQSLFLQMG